MVRTFHLSSPSLCHLSPYSSIVRSSRQSQTLQQRYLTLLLAIYFSTWVFWVLLVAKSSLTRDNLVFIHSKVIGSAGGLETWKERKPWELQNSSSNDNISSNGNTSSVAATTPATTAITPATTTATTPATTTTTAVEEEIIITWIFLIKSWTSFKESWDFSTFAELSWHLTKKIKAEVKLK